MTNSFRKTGKGMIRYEHARKPNDTHLAQPVIAQHQREEEPQHQLTTEQRSVEVGDCRWRLSVVLCVRGQSTDQKRVKERETDLGAHGGEES